MCSQHFRSEDKHDPKTAAFFTGFLHTPKGSWSTAGVSYKTWIFTRATTARADKLPPDRADCMKIQQGDPGRDWLTGTPIIPSQRKRVTHYKHSGRFARRTTTTKKKISKYLHEKRKRCRWKINLPGYIAPSRSSEKKGDCRDEIPDSLCICTHPPANIHYINQNNGSSREDPHNPSSCTIIFPRGCMHVQRNGKNPHFSMRLLPAFSILLPLLQMCL